MANDELDALNALEKEAKEYDKVCFHLDFLSPEEIMVLTRSQRMPRLIVSIRPSDLMRKSTVQTDDT